MLSFSYSWNIYPKALPISNAVPFTNDSAFNHILTPKMSIIDASNMIAQNSYENK